jgi:hypothetical protein
MDHTWQTGAPMAAADFIALSEAACAGLEEIVDTNPDGGLVVMKRTLKALKERGGTFTEALARAVHTVVSEWEDDAGIEAWTKLDAALKGAAGRAPSLPASADYDEIVAAAQAHYGRVNVDVLDVIANPGEAADMGGAWVSAMVWVELVDD